MKVKHSACLVTALLISVALALPAWAAHVNVIELDNQIINPVTDEYIGAGIARAVAERAECLVILLDTPGGLFESTRSIVKRIMSADVPVVVYVAPAGSRAGSAGVFITMAAHVAAMAPTTNIGAAHPVGEGIGGVKKLIRKFRRTGTPEELAKQQGKKSEEEVVEETEEDPMTAKVLNDTVAWVTTIAKARGRNADWAVKAVKESVSVTEQEALKEHVVDLVATDLDDLLAKLEGRVVSYLSVVRVLHTKAATVVKIPMSGRQRILAVITNPNIAYLLMTFGFLGLVFEFTHPGFGFPGIAGAICLVLALFAFHTLPVNYAGLFFILLGVVLFIAEIKITSYGLLTVGGLVAMTLGSLMLIDSPFEFLQVSLTVILPVVLTTAGIFLFLVGAAVRAHRQPVKGGAEGLIGEIGTAQTALQPEGKVFVHGELWDASSANPVPAGAAVRITGVHGLHLVVTQAT